MADPIGDHRRVARRTALILTVPPAILAFLLAGAARGQPVWSTMSPYAEVHFTVAVDQMQEFHAAIRSLALAEQLRVLQGATVATGRTMPTVTLSGRGVTIAIAPRAATATNENTAAMSASVFCDDPCPGWDSLSDTLMTVLTGLSMSPPQIRQAKARTIFEHERERPHADGEPE